MPVPMSKEEIAITIERMRGINDSVPDAHHNRVIERICNYIDANLDDFMECYDDLELHDTNSLSDIIGGGQG